MFKVIYGVLNLHIILSDFFDISLQTQVFYLLIWFTVAVQLYKYALIWVLQDQQKAEQVFSEKLQHLTQLSTLPEVFIREHLVPIIIDAVTLKNIQHTIAFFLALNLSVSYLTLFLTNKAVRSISLHILFGLYYHYSKNQNDYLAYIEKLKKLGAEKWQIIERRLQKQKI